jgi:hypothetical protein
VPQSASQNRKRNRSRGRALASLDFGRPLAFRSRRCIFVSASAPFSLRLTPEIPLSTRVVLRMQTAGLVLPCGAQAPILSGQRKICCPKVSVGGRSAAFSTRVPAAAVRSRSSRTAAVAVTASTASSNGNLLPWQAAMDDVKKRKDLKSIMIIGAGPIVIGQVGPASDSKPTPVGALTHKVLTCCLT